MPLVIKKATENELSAIVRLLQDNHLPTIDLEDKIIFAGFIDDILVATIGIEYYESEALLRSMAVKDGYKKKSIGEQMLSFLLAHSADQKIKELYLITTTARSYFEKFGFSSIDRTLIPLSIQSTQEFSTICPSSAEVMYLTTY